MEATPEAAPDVTTGSLAPAPAQRKVLGSLILGQVDLPNGLTLTGLVLAALSAFTAARGLFYPAILCIIGSGVADLFDGYLARRSTRTPLAGAVGQHLDSICDMVSFGFAPAFFAYMLGLREPYQVPLLVAFVCAAALRLAYFDAVGLTGDGDKQYFTGMPVTYNALFVPIAFLPGFFLDPEDVQWIFTGLFGLLTVAMVAGVRVPKPTGVWYGIFGTLAIAVGAVYTWAFFNWH
jgi:CDP-diacylglycerol--serine O-phosphatidyltransferase